MFFSGGFSAMYLLLEIASLSGDKVPALKKYFRYRAKFSPCYYPFLDFAPQFSHRVTTEVVFSECYLLSHNSKIIENIASILTPTCNQIYNKNYACWLCCEPPPSNLILGEGWSAVS